jgi:TonB-dependent receptor
VSAEQVRRSPDKDAGDVLRRVTGLSVEDGKYVFVRGLGERYSSTEVDGVRLVSPEVNKRVVPLDLLPASLLDNVVVQKTYTADRPGEFGGGDVQVKTRDFPGQRVWSFSVSQGFDEGTTFEKIRSYAGSNRDVLGMGGSDRDIPDYIRDAAAGQRIALRGLDPAMGFTRDTLAAMGRSFRNEWSAGSTTAIPNGSYVQNYGDEWELFGRSLGFVQSATYSRSLNQQDEVNRYFVSGDTLYDFDVVKSTESVQLGGLAALSYRLAPSHSVHVRSMVSRSAEDEVRVHEGVDNNTGAMNRGTRLLYVERAIWTGAVEGKHEFPAWRNARIDWRYSRSSADRVQPDRRETTYQRVDYIDDNDQPQSLWVLKSNQNGASREFADLDERGHGVEVNATLPLDLRAFGKGKLAGGFSYQKKNRNAFQRRFWFAPANGQGAAPPESLFQDDEWDGSPSGARLGEYTFDDDNYDAEQKQRALYVSADLSLGPRVRANLGVRGEHGVQRVRSFDLFEPDRTTGYGWIDATDLLPSANLSWAITNSVSLRAAASRTVSRPDLRELSPAKAFEFQGGLRTAGNPDLTRARIDNYDLRAEMFPGLSEVVAAGVFYKQLYDPIEMVIRPGDAPFFQPQNSERGRNVGVELEARTSLGRVWKGLQSFAVNANFSAIASEVRARRFGSELGNPEHPLQGQAKHLVNGSLSWTAPHGGADLTVLVSNVGERLQTLGVAPQPDIYEQEVTTLDVAANWRAFPWLRLKLAGRNLTDATYRAKQGDKETNRYQPGRSFSVSLAYGS